MKVSTGPTVEDALREALAHSAVRRIEGRNATKADIYVHRGARLAVALKDYGRRPFVVRQTLGRWLVARECRAYRHAGDVAGLPRFLGRIGPWALATEWVEARPLAERAERNLSPQIFDALDRIVSELHRRGVALADLHHRDVLVGVDEAVHVVDLALAFVRGDRAGVLRRRLFDRLAEQDLVAAARLRARFCGGDPDAALRRLGPRAAARYRNARRLKRWFDRLRGRRRK